MKQQQGIKYILVTSKNFEPHTTIPSELAIYRQKDE